MLLHILVLYNQLKHCLIFFLKSNYLKIKKLAIFYLKLNRLALSGHQPVWRSVCVRMERVRTTCNADKSSKHCSFCLRPDYLSIWYYLILSVDQSFGFDEECLRKSSYTIIPLVVLPAPKRVKILLLFRPNRLNVFPLSRSSWWHAARCNQRMGRCREATLRVTVRSITRTTKSPP